MTATQPSTPATTFTIDSQAHNSGVGPGNNFTTGVDIYFTTAKGNQGKVFVPDSLYTVTYAQAAVAAKAAALDAVSNLTQ